MLPIPSPPEPDATETPAAPTRQAGQRVRYAHVESGASWQDLFQQAADFATALGPGRVISISHAQVGEGLCSSGVVTVWYWEDEP